MKLNIGDTLHLELDLYIKINKQGIEYNKNEFKKTLDEFIHAYFNKEKYKFTP